MRRRDFLTAAAASAAMGWPRTSRAEWGQAPAYSGSALLQPGERAERCLELRLVTRERAVGQAEEQQGVWRIAEAAHGPNRLVASPGDEIRIRARRPPHRRG